MWLRALWARLLGRDPQPTFVVVVLDPATDFFHNRHYCREDERVLSIAGLKKLAAATGLTVSTVNDTRFGYLALAEHTTRNETVRFRASAESEDLAIRRAISGFLKVKPKYTLADLEKPFLLPVTR